MTDATQPTAPPPEEAREKWQMQVVMTWTAFGAALTLIAATVAFAFYKGDAGLIKNTQDWSFFTLLAVLATGGIVGGISQLPAFAAVLSAKK